MTLFLLAAHPSAAQQAPPPSLPPAVLEADALVQRKEHAAALAVFREHLKATPADFRLWMRVADCEVELGNRAAAIAALDEVARLRPDLAGVEAVKGLRVRAEAIASGREGTTGQPRTTSAPTGGPAVSVADVALARRAAELILERVRGKPALEQASAGKLAMGRLAPALLVPDAADAGVWRVAGLCALATGDDDLAALAFEAIGRLRPDYHAEPAMLDLMAALDARPIEGQKEVLRALAVSRAAFNHQVSVVSEYAGPDAVASWLGKAADAGSPEAMVALAIRLVGGWGIESDQRRSVELLERAYEAGSTQARALLGLAYSASRGQDAAKDRAIFERLVERANAGDAKAMEWAGRMLLDGRGGVAKDESKAVEWSRKAAEAGDAAGMNNLGVAYDTGRGGLPKDEAKAVEWYRKAADAGVPSAMYQLGLFYKDGRGGLAKDEALAVACWRISAEFDIVGAMNNLGVAYDVGLGGLPKDEAKSVEWLRKAAEAGSPGAMSNLGVAYDTGRGGLPKDAAKASKWREARDRVLKGEAASAVLKDLGLP